MSRGRRAALIAVVAVAFIAVLAVRGAGRFDVAAHKRAAARVLSSPLAVVHPLRPPPGVHSDERGEFAYLPGSQMSVVSLEGLAPLAGDDQYLVFLEARNIWVLAGSVTPDSAGAAQVRFDGVPNPVRIYQVVVCRGADTADSAPHGPVTLWWIDPRALAAGAAPFVGAAS